MLRVALQPYDMHISIDWSKNTLYILTNCAKELKDINW